MESLQSTKQNCIVFVSWPAGLVYGLHRGFRASFDAHILCMLCITEQWQTRQRILYWSLSLSFRGSADNTAQFLFNILKEYNIHRIICSITTDNATTMKFAMKRLQELLDQDASANGTTCPKFSHIRCAAHVSNLCAKAAIVKFEHLSSKLKKAYGKIKKSFIIRKIFVKKNCLMSTEMSCQVLMWIHARTAPIKCRMIPFFLDLCWSRFVTWRSTASCLLVAGERDKLVLYRGFLTIFYTYTVRLSGSS